MFSVFKSYFKKKHRITIMLKSGATVEFTCAEFKIQKQGNELVGYQIVGGDYLQMMYVNLDQVEAIINHV